MWMFLTAADHQGVWAVEAIRIRRALRRAELSDKAAAAKMGIDKGRFSKMLAGVEHFSWTLAAELPDAFRQAYAMYVLMDLGLTSEMQRSWRIALAVMGQKRMVRMTRSESERKAS